MEGFDVVGAALERATVRAMADRSQFRPLLAVVEKFAASAGLILGGKQGLRALLAGSAPPPEDLDSFARDYWATGRGLSPLQAARGLADAVWRADPDGLGRLTHVETRVANFRFAVFAGGRVIATVTSLPGGARETLGVPRPAQFAGGVTVLVAAPILAAIGVYAALDDFAQQARAPALLEAEAVLRPAIISIGDDPENQEDDRLPRQEARQDPHRDARREGRREGRRGRYGARRGARRGGADQYTAPAARWGADQYTVPAARWGGTAVNQISQLWHELLREYLHAPGRATAGGFAVAATHGHTPDANIDRQMVIVLTQHSFEAESAVLTTLARRCGVDALCTVTDPQIPGDPRTRRLAMTIPEKSGRITILIVYNVAAHELVACTQAMTPATKTMVAGLLTVMRWALVEIWSSRLRVEKGIASREDHRVLWRSFDTYRAASQMYDQALAKLAAGAAGAADAAVINLVAPNEYYGEYEDVEVSMRREARTSARQVFHASYYPARAHGAARR